jgi:hypothetical protein
MSERGNPPYLSAACAEGPRRDRGARMGCARAASSLVIGALLGTARPWHDRLVGLVLAFGAGALISAVSFDLAQEGARLGDPGVLALGLGLGATAYFALNRMLARPRRRGNEAAADDDGSTELALGAFLDGVPEQLVLGIGVATGEGVSVSLLVAIFVQPPGGDRLVRRDARRGDPTGGDPSALDVRRAGLHRVRRPRFTGHLVGERGDHVMAA